MEFSIEEFNAPHPDFRSGMISVVGRTNAGKSSLINALIGEKVSIISSREQTTRHMVRGIYTDDDCQLVFLDTPGLHKSRSDMGKAMNKTAKQSTSGVDVVLMIFDVSEEPRAEDESWLRRAAFYDMPVIAVLNKMDRKGANPQPFKELFKNICAEKEVTREIIWLESSATTGAGLEEILETCRQLSPKGPLLFPKEMLSDFPKKLLLGDLIREPFLPELKDEVPHSMAVWVEYLSETEDTMNIEAYIYVERPTQKGIVIGKNGTLIKKAQSMAVKSIREVYEKRVNLNLIVKVEPNWRQNFWLLKQLGIVGDKEK